MHLVVAKNYIFWYNISMYSGVKRLLDIVFGVFGLILLVPLSIAVKIAYIANGDFDGIFYNQIRIGKDGKKFRMFKFRTMSKNADKKLAEVVNANAKTKAEYKKNHKLSDDPRITKVGKVIRRLSLDEIPQSINVLIGQMSLVGNRPYLLREKTEMGSYYKPITSVKPGITGYWQISGRNNLSFKKRLELEKYYSEYASFKLDCKILFRTLSVVIIGRGAK